MLLIMHLHSCLCADTTNWVKKAEERAKVKNDDLPRQKGAYSGAEAGAGGSQPSSESGSGGVDGSVDDDGEEDGEQGAAEFDHPDEWFYFKGLDMNKDGALDRKEFEHHLEIGNDGGQLERRDEYLMGFMVGREWAELHEDGDSHKEAFNGVDYNSDGKITWKEWVGEIYHDVPQRPSFVDGEIGKDVADEGMFSEYDADKNGYLNYDELAKFVATWVNREDVDEDYAGNQPDEEHTAEGHVGQTYVMLFEFDSDNDQMVSLEEWKQGFAKEAHGPPPGSVLLQHV
jgi:Ca2+-binding EF-hand superfamily protein